MPTFAQYYDDPPSGQVNLTFPGNATTAPYNPSDPPSPENLPRHIIEDSQLCNTLLTFARNHLGGAPNPPTEFDYLHRLTRRIVDRATVGDETVNVDVFTQLSIYVAEFVVLADNLGPNAIQILSCANEGGIRPNRKILRNGTDRVIVEHKSVAAYNAHVTAIRALAQGQGTEIIASQHETGPRSIILKLGKHMIDTGTRWGVLMGGRQFMVFFMKQLYHNNRCYHHMVASNSHTTIVPPGPTQGIPGPCLISVLIALLLGNNPTASYTQPPNSRVITAYEGGDRSSRSTRNRGTGPRSKASSQRVPMARRRPMTRSMGRVKAHAAKQLHEHCLMSFPNSGLPDRQIALTRVSPQIAWDTMTGASSNLPETTPVGDITYHTDAGNQEPLQVLGLEKLGYGVCGVVYDSVCIADNNSEETRAMKFVEHDFPSFWRELVVYDKLEDQPFIPAFYGGFAGQWISGPLGIIIMEMLERSFQSADEMSLDEKSQALSCAEQLHAAGFCHGDIGPHNFGVRKDGKVVIFDFSHAGPCDSSASARFEVQHLRESIFGENEEGQG